MEKLRFSDPLPNLVLEGSKNTTWRMDDEKNIEVGDLLSFCRVNGEEFAKAELFGVKETTFGQLTEEDKSGHEPFSSDREMYETCSGYYEKKVTPKTKLKVIKFRLI
ncbi:MAG: ASCH domain-containing protein [Candidatus Shapirobacteria bacterium]